MKVYVIKDKGNIKHLQYLFNKFSEINLIEDGQIINILTKEEEHNSKDCTLFVRQSCISQLDNEQIHTKITSIVNKCEKFDIYYLMTWGDACHKRRDFDKKLNLYTCYEPNGLHAVLITPRGRKRILGIQKMDNGYRFNVACTDITKEIRVGIMEDALTAIVSHPPLMTLDTNAIVDNKQYGCLNHCRSIAPVSDSNNTNTYIWIILGIILLIAIIWIWFCCYCRVKV